MPEKEIPVKDFLEEHRRLKENKSVLQPTAASQQAQKPAVQASATPALQQALPAVVPLPTVSQPSVSHPPVEPQQLSLVQLLESLRGLGYDVKPLESLKGFADQLDAEEQRLVKEIQERQERLRVVREARRLLRVLGV